MQRRELPDGWDRDIPTFEADEKGIATRKASNKVQNAIAEQIPWLLSGSADLTDSTSVRLTTRRRSDGDFEPEHRAGRQLHYGIREHESAAISNGLSLSKLRPVVVDLPGLLRLRAARDPPLGADGAAGDPHLHPRLDRPRRGRPDPPAGRAARLAARDPGPQRDPPLRRERGRRGVAGDDRAGPTGRPRWCSPARTCRSSTARCTRRAEGLRRGGYVLADADGEGDPELILIATGSEVALAVEAHEKLAADGVRSRVVSLPSLYLFEQQDQEYRDRSCRRR